MLWGAILIDRKAPHPPNAWKDIDIVYSFAAMRLFGLSKIQKKNWQAEILPNSSSVTRVQTIDAAMQWCRDDEEDDDDDGFVGRLWYCTPFHSLANFKFKANCKHFSHHHIYHHYITIISPLYHHVMPMISPFFLVQNAAAFPRPMAGETPAISRGASHARGFAKGERAVPASGDSDAGLHDKKGKITINGQYLPSGYLT